MSVKNIGTGFIRPNTIKTTKLQDGKRAYPYSIHEELGSDATIDGDVDMFNETFAYLFYRTMTEQRGFDVPGLFDFSTVIYASGLSKEFSQSFFPIAQELVVTGPPFSYFSSGSHVNRLLAVLTNPQCDNIRLNSPRADEIYITYNCLPKDGDKAESAYVKLFKQRLLGMFPMHFTAVGRLVNASGIAATVNKEVQNVADTIDRAILTERDCKDGDFNEVVVKPTQEQLSNVDQDKLARMLPTEESNGTCLFTPLKEAGRAILRFNPGLDLAAVVRLELDTNDKPKQVSLRHLGLAAALGLFHTGNDPVSVKLTSIQKAIQDDDKAKAKVLGKHWMDAFDTWKELPTLLSSLGATIPAKKP